MSNCIFCKIEKGEVPAKKIYESKYFFAILDAHPIVEGHCLLIPKRHYETIHKMNKEESLQFGEDCITLAKMLKNYWPDLTIANSNGKFASQAVPHYHVHFIPRQEGDRLWDEDKSKISLDVSSGFERLKPSKDELEQLANKLIGDTHE
ncbi:HIT family protein [Candidatus Woesearchaeota archaeon]|nr:HIT family protein [Candidatus Woesearchaeota archaeon]